MSVDGFLQVWDDDTPCFLGSACTYIQVTSLYHDPVTCTAHPSGEVVELYVAWAHRILVIDIASG